MDSRRVSWVAHSSSIHHRAGVLDVPAAEGDWVDTVHDADGQPSAVVVTEDGRALTVRLKHLKVLK